MGSQRPSKAAVTRSIATCNPPPTAQKSSGFFSALCMPKRASRSVPPTSRTQCVIPNPEKSKPTRRSSYRNSLVSERTEKSPTRVRVVEDISAAPKSRPRYDSVWLATDFLWPSGSSIPRPYMGLAKEDDLWLPTGDCLVFFEESRQKCSPASSLRVESRTIAGAGIPFLNTLLAAGRRSRRCSQASTQTTPMSTAIPNYPNSHRLSPSRRQLKRSSVGCSPSPRSISSSKFSQAETLVDVAMQAKRLTLSSNTRRHSNLSDNREQREDGPSYEIWFAVPEHLSDQEKHKHKLAIRNLLAMLHNKPIVGAEPIQALCDVQELIDIFSAKSPMDSPNGHRPNRPFNSASMQKKDIVTTYVSSMKLNDVRHNLRQALTFLRWTESHSTRWSAGYSETFTHVVGMMTPRTLQTSEFKRLSSTTRHTLQESFNALQMVTMEAEDKLKTFDFSQIWNLQRYPLCGTRKSFDYFRNFLITFYRKKYGIWPPTVSASNGRWLDRDVVTQLQTDFGALYDYLVDRNVQWDNLKASYHRQWEMGRRGSEGFKADGYVPITKMLVGFDDFHGLLHIPYPYPLLPLGHVGSTDRRGSYHSLSHVVNAPAFDERESLRTSTAYSAATNICRLSNLTQGNELLEAFRYHEKSIILDGVSLQEARLGRWILLYGVLQVLSLLSVDASGLRYTADVNYFLCAAPSEPSWANSEKANILNEPSQTKSYCWTAPDRWTMEKPVYRAPFVTTSLDDDRATPRGHHARIDSPLSEISSRLTGTDWGDTDLGYSPVSEGAAQLLPLQYGYKGRLLDVEKGGRIVHSVA